MSLTILLHPDQRQAYLDEMLLRDGLSDIQEDFDAAYCPISLTATPEQLKPYLLKRQKLLMYDVLEPAGLKAYDPATAPYSPDLNLTAQPQEVYMVDMGKIASARFFVGHNIIASTGFGDECEIAKNLNRISVVLMDKKIRISRMQTTRTIYLQYDNFEAEKAEFIQVFKFLQHFTPGLGLENGIPVLIARDERNGEIVNLETVTYEAFPHLRYEYDGQIGIVKLKPENPELFYEYHQ
jgi:hypothetical protein